MLQDIRRSSRSGWTYILVGLLIVVFAVFFGVPGDACGSGASRKLVASVSGTDLYTDDVGLVYNRVYGNRRRVDEAQMRQQQAQALRSMLLLQLLAEKGREHGLRVSDAELVEYLKDPLRNAEYRSVYGRDGGFDGPLYKAYVQNQLRVSIPRYEDFKKTELLARKYLNLVEMQFQASPWEVKELNELRNTKVDLEFAQFDPEALAEYVPATDEEIDAYVTAEAQAIKDHYDANKADYEEPEKVVIRRIYIVKPDEAEGKEQVKAAIEKWDKAKTRVNGGENFADVAGELSESERETQGLMEPTTLQNIDQNIATKVKDLKVGETAEVETDYAFMLVKLEERTEAVKTPLKDVQRDIARKLLQEKKVENLIGEMIAELRKNPKASESLQDAIDALKSGGGDEGEGEDTGEESEEQKSMWDGVTVDTTGEFTLEGQDLAALFGRQFPGMQQRAPWDRVPKIGKNPDLARDAFKMLTPDKPLSTKPYKVSGKYYLVRLAKRTDPTKEELEDQEVKLEAEARGAKVASVLGPYAAVFSFPMDDYGPFLEGILDRAMEDGTVQLYERNYDAIPLVKKDEGGEEEKEAEGSKEKLKIDLTQPSKDKEG
jgi:parvulin-like peptidyl-prolyl isomerase